MISGLRTKGHEYRVYRCSRAVRSVLGAKNCGCAGRRFTVRARDVDAAVWAEAKELAKDSEKVQRMVAKRRNGGQDALDEARRDMRWTDEQISQAQESLSFFKSQLGQARDERRVNLLLEQVVQAEDKLTQLHARREAVAKRTANLDAWMNHYDETLRRIFGKNVKDTADTKTFLVGDTYALVVVSPKPETLDSPSYADKRAVLELLGCRVEMYAADSDYFREHGKQWKIEWSPDKDIVSSFL